MALPGVVSEHESGFNPMGRARTFGPLASTFPALRVSGWSEGVD